METSIFDYNQKVKPKFDSLEHQKMLVDNVKKTKHALSKVELVYNILHDVQAVHQGVDSCLRLIMDSNVTPSQQEWESTCSDIKRKSNLLSEMVDCAIELLQYENLADVPRVDEVPVNAFCQDMFDACQRYLNNAAIELSFETSLADDYTVRTNMGYLRKLVKNLMVCSMDFTTEGYIKMVVMEDKNRKFLRFILSDTGQGIPDHVKDTVFEKLPNDDLHNKIVGVRLRICRALTHLLGGSIYLDPFYNDGTSIVFTIAI